MLQSTYTYCKCADTLSNFVSKLLLVSILVLPTSAQVDFTFNADTAESSFQVSDPAFCEPPDKPGRTAWSGELLSNSSSTYTVYQPRPVVPLHASVGDNQVKVLESIHKHPLMLSQSQVASGTTSAGNVNRVSTFCRKLLSGEAVTIALLGGSWTSGSGVENPGNTWPAQLFSWINSTFPHPDHVFVNNATRGATSGFVTPCLHTFVPATADLILLEFAINDGYYDHTEMEMLKDRKWYEDRFETPARRAFERMLRQLMVLPKAPAIVYVHAWEGRRNHTNFYWGVEDKYNTMLTYYGLGSLSMRNSLHEVLLQQPELQNKIWPPDDGHPTCLGTRVLSLVSVVQTHDSYATFWRTRLLSDLVIAYLMDRCTHTLLRNASHASTGQQSGNVPARESSRKLSVIPHRHHDHLPAPLFSNNHGRHASQCFLDSSEMELIITDQKGFKWTNEGTAVNPRWGYVSHTSTDYITLQFDHGSYKNLENSLVVGISLLTSYEHMGMLDVACSQGCGCNSSAFNTCNPNMAWSEVRWAFHRVQVKAQNDSCLVQLTNAVHSHPSCQGNKLKIQAMLVSGESETAGSASLGLKPQQASGV